MDATPDEDAVDELAAVAAAVADEDDGGTDVVVVVVVDGITLRPVCFMPPIDAERFDGIAIDEPDEPIALVDDE